jgi:hypothetical protein
MRNKKMKGRNSFNILKQILNAVPSVRTIATKSGPLSDSIPNLKPAGAVFEGETGYKELVKPAGPIFEGETFFVDSAPSEPKAKLPSKKTEVQPETVTESTPRPFVRK